MEFYTLNSLFQKEAVVDKFRSAIWTERFIQVGDAELIVDPTAENIAKLEEGKFLSLVGTKEVVQIDTALVEDGVLKVTGNMLPIIFKDRFVWLNDLFAGLIGGGSGSYPIEVMTYIPVYFADPTVVNGGDSGYHDAYSLFVDYGLAEYDKQIITNMDVWFPGTFTGDLVETVYEPGSVLDFLLKYAEQLQIGFRLYLDSVDPSTNDYRLMYRAYEGRDLTRDQTTNDPVIFSSAMDTLSGVSRLRSIAGYKTVVYAFAGDGSTFDSVYVPGTESYTDFQRREHFMKVEGATVEDAGSLDNVHTLLQKAAKDFLANNNYVKMLDGEIVPQSQFKFGEHYGLGDIVELDDESEITQKARVIEYIRSQDETGERAYPTVSVIE